MHGLSELIVAMQNNTSGAFFFLLCLVSVCYTFMVMAGAFAKAFGQKGTSLNALMAAMGQGEPKDKPIEGFNAKPKSIGFVPNTNSKNSGKSF